MTGGSGVRLGRMVLTGLVLTIGAAALIHAITNPGRPDIAADQPWIRLPSSGMDAGEHAVRQLLLRLDPDKSLAYECGNPFLQRGASDRYMAHIGNAASRLPAWRVAMEIRNGDIEIRWNDSTILTPSFRTAPVVIPERSRPAYADLVRVVPTATTIKTRDELDHVRARWLDPALWDAPQQSNRCINGNLVFLEACVGGRYAARTSGCGDSARAAVLLWEAFNEVLPTPPRPYWRDATGRRIDLD